MIKLFEHIGAKIKAANPWIDSFAVNCIQLPDGRVVNLVGIEKSDFSFNDTLGYFFYIRVNPKIDYTLIRQLSSLTKEYRVTVRWSFVFFAITEENLDPVKLENNFSNNFRLMNFNDYFGPERQPEIVIVNSNIDSISVFATETKKELKSGSAVHAISVDGQLRFLSTNDCQQCGISTSANVLQSFDFCDPSVLAQLCSNQVECLKKAFGGNGMNCDDLAACEIIKNIQKDISDLKEEVQNIPGGHSENIDVFNSTNGLVNGQTIFNLSFVPASGTEIKMLINGVDIDSYTQVGNVVTYTGTTYMISSTDFIKFVYYTN